MARPADQAGPEAPEDEIRTVTLSPHAGSRVIAVIGFSLGLALILVYLMTGGGQTLFHRTDILRTFMPDGTGLVRTALVELDGIEVGHVKSVTLTRIADPNRAVLVELKIRRNYLRAIPIDSKTELTADNLLGDKYINIRKGSNPRAVDAGSELAAQISTSTFDPADLLTSLKQILQSANQLLEQIDDPTTNLGQFVRGEEIYASFLSTVTGIQTSLHKYANPRSPAGQAVYGQELYQQLRHYVLDIDKQIAQVQANPMLANTSQYDAWLAQAKSLHQSIDNIHATPLLRDNELYANMRQQLESLTDTVNALSAGPLFTSTQLYESLNGSSRDARVFLGDFRRNPQKYLRIKLF